MHLCTHLDNATLRRVLSTSGAEDRGVQATTATAFLRLTLALGEKSRGQGKKSSSTAAFRAAERVERNGEGDRRRVGEGGKTGASTNVTGRACRRDARARTMSRYDRRSWGS